MRSWSFKPPYVRFGAPSATVANVRRGCGTGVCVNICEAVDGSEPRQPRERAAAQYRAEVSIKVILFSVVAKEGDGQGWGAFVPDRDKLLDLGSGTRLIMEKQWQECANTLLLI